MKIPNMTLSATQLRRYGTGGFRLEGHEAEKGCPRQYKAYYVDKVEDNRPPSYELRYGRFFHQVLFLMEEDQMTPEEAIATAFEPDMEQRAWTEAREDLENYLSREAAPSDRYGVLAVEQELKAELYVDEDFGPVYYRGFLDVVGIDLENEGVLHIGDYKTNRAPARFEDLVGDVQMRGYDWLARQVYRRWVKELKRVVTHLDVVKFRDVEIGYTDSDIEDWHSWAVAVARKILRDDAAEPVLNPGCGHCFVRDTCPAFTALPSLAESLAEEGSVMKDPVERLAWRDRANKIKGLLDKSIKSIDQEFEDQALRQGSIRVGDQLFRTEPKWDNVINLEKLHQLLGNEDFYRTVKASKASIERVTKGWEPSKRDKVLGAITREATGTKVTRTVEGTFE